MVPTAPGLTLGETQVRERDLSSGKVKVSPVQCSLHVFFSGFLRSPGLRVAHYKERSRRLSRSSPIWTRTNPVQTANEGRRYLCFIRRSMSRFVSRDLIASRLSYFFFPRAEEKASFILLLVLYNDNGTSVKPFVASRPANVESSFLVSSRRRGRAGSYSEGVLAG